ncbi:MAG: hypothetical protein IKS20_00185, partial [Victivallales bacterium]|nr:hypothetical protein [Victivallales bacterium]
LARTSGNNMKSAEKTLANEALKKLAPAIGPRTVVALDFDGVICDSARETGMSGWKACRRIWPDLYKGELPGHMAIKAFRRVRPFLETGYHAILLTKMLQEKLPFEEFEQNSQFHFQRIMQENNLDKQKLIGIFGETRDQWIREDEKGWLAVHDFFDGVLDALNALLNPTAKSSF